MFRGIAWTALWRWTSQAISWGATIYTVRMLNPADFGIVAMATIPIGLARLIEDLGLDTVVIQDRSLEPAHLRQLAGAALVLGVCLTCFFVALAEAIAKYFHEPDVAIIVSVLSITFVVDALQILPRAMLQRDLRFQTLAWLAGTQVIIAAFLRVACAAAGLGFWALVVPMVVSHIVVTVAFVFLRPYGIAWPRHLRKLSRSLISGWQLIVSRLSYYGYSTIDSTIIGRFLGKEDLGIYGMAMTFASVATREFTSLVNPVLPGVFTTIQSSTDELRRYFLLLSEAIAYLSIPAAIGLAITADDFVLLALGDKWQGVIVPLRILCLYMFINSCQHMLSPILVWTGRFSVNMWLNLFALAVIPACVYFSVGYGIDGVAWALVFGFPLSIAPAIPIVGKLLKISFFTFWQALRPAVVSCAGMSIAVLLLRQMLPLDWHHGIRLGIQAALGATVYICILWVFFRERLLEIYGTMRGD